MESLSLSAPGAHLGDQDHVADLQRPSFGDKQVLALKQWLHPLPRLTLLK
jgi:hypothetical protein